MVFHPSHRPLEIATRFPQFHSPDDDDISPTNKKHKGTLLSSYRGGHFYWALTQKCENRCIAAADRLPCPCHEGQNGNPDYWLLLAEGHLNRRLFGEMLAQICALPLPSVDPRLTVRNLSAEEGGSQGGLRNRMGSSETARADSKKGPWNPWIMLGPAFRRFRRQIGCVQGRRPGIMTEPGGAKSEIPGGSTSATVTTS